MIKVRFVIALAACARRGPFEQRGEDRRSYDSSAQAFEEDSSVL